MKHRSWNHPHTLCILSNLRLQDTLLGMLHTCCRDQKKERVEDDHILQDHFHACAIVNEKALDRWQIL